ncbi:DUF58 domain-containing protein [Salinibacterium sp. ZJ77]|uniref:DUF58 domain-containing protein n=1 Tax=Salinibacterium sp. ZJ77 TaxID=2708337 RepID=UPI0014215AE2|nr:DUF58 domain-containing protein [Salinibacterium sp. ZJ77]
MKNDTEARLGRTATVTGTRTRGATVTRYSDTRTGFVAGGQAARRRLVARVGRTVSSAARWLAETVSAAGWLLAAVLVLGLVAGIGWGWAEGWVAAVIAFVLLLVCVPFLLGRHDYAIRLELERDRVVAGSVVSGVLDVANRGERVGFPALIDIPVGDGLVEAHVPLLRSGADYRERLTISAARRGIITVGPMTIGRGDPLGILRREHVWDDVQTIYVHPVTVPIPSTSAGLLRDLEGSPTSTIVDSDLAFHAIRDYAAGDSRRHVHWKSTAKTGKLMVRQYEETRRSRIAVLLDLETARYGSEEEFELAVSVASSLGVQAVRDGRDVLVTASAIIPEYARGRVHSIRTLPTVNPKTFLDGMAGIASSDDVMGLEEVARLTVQAESSLSLVFIVTGSEQQLARLRQAALAFPADVTVVALRCEPGAEPLVRQARELRVLDIGVLHDVSHLMARGVV